jgi:hypothetical protein
LIVAIPPRHLKSLAASIALPAWLLGHDPTAAIVAVTYGQELSDKFARDCRAIMMASWYRELFATRLNSNRASLGELVTTAGGFRLATSVGGVLTGRGASGDQGAHQTNSIRHGEESLRRSQPGAAAPAASWLAAQALSYNPVGVRPSP